MQLDQIDIKILCELQKNGRISNVELGDVVHLSAGPCLMRVKELQSEGFAKRWTIDLPDRLPARLTIDAACPLRFSSRKCETQYHDASGGSRTLRSIRPRHGSENWRRCACSDHLNRSACYLVNDWFAELRPRGPVNLAHPDPVDA